jgi:hypothetical protein
VNEITGTTYGIELLFADDYDLGAPSILAALRAGCPDADVQGQGGTIAIFHRDVPIELANGSVCAQTAVLGSDQGVTPEELEPLLQQTRDWPGARDAVARARRRLLVTDLMSSSLGAPQRLDVFMRATAALVRVLRPIAIAWRTAGKVVDPDAFLRAMESGDRLDKFLVAMNVRMFNVGNEPGEMVMDTMGLASLRVPDLQVHYRDLDPNDVAHHLFNTALYVFEKGDVLEDGHTVDGVAPGQKWRCQHEEPLVGPKRVVVDLNPGSPYAGGDR